MMAHPATGDEEALATLIASQTNDEMQAILRSRRKSGLPGGLGDSRAIRAAIYENLTQMMMNRVRESAERAESHT